MRKKILLTTMITLLSLFFVAYSGLNYGLLTSYKFSEDFKKIAMNFWEDTATSRAFSFYTDDEDYIDKCYVQLDPAEKNEETPFFKDKDNIIIKAESEYTKFLFPVELRHYAVAEDLVADQKYFYRVGSKDNNKWSKWGWFITDDKDDSFTFMHVTDSQAETVEEFAAVSNSFDKAYQTVGVPEFIVSTGDQVELGVVPEQWDIFFDSLGEFLMQTTFAPVSGNHEFLPTPVNYHFYLNLESKRICYSYEYGNALFVILDTNDGSLVTQMEWMEDIFEQSDKKWKIVAFHKAPFSSGTHADDSEVLKIKQVVTPLLAKHNVDLVLNGHDHIYCRTYPIDGEGNIASQQNKETTTYDDYTKYTYTNPQGAIYVINRCIGIKFYSKSNSLNDHLIEVGDQQKVSKPVFSNVKINGNTLEYTAYEYDRENTEEVTVLDCFEIIK